MKENFETALKFILADEGKFSNLPDDKGGPTNLGITLKTLVDYHHHFDYGDFDRNGDVDINDIRLLDILEEAAPIYKRYFWDRIRGDDLPGGLDYVIFDSAVNHGPRNAAIILQRAIGRWDHSFLIDGIIGDETIQAAVKWGSGILWPDIVKERDLFYRKIVARDLSQEVFLKGWLNRLARVVVNTRQFV